MGLETENALQSWKRKADDWLSRSSAGDAEATGEKRTKYRKKSYEWLLGTERQFQAVLAEGWGRFVISDEQFESFDPFRWPHITVSPDQGSDGVCSLGFLSRAKRINVSVAWDPSHAVWNDFRGALRWSDLHSFQLLLVVVYNMSYGPWSEARWFHEVRQGLREYLRLTEGAPDRCPLFCFLAEAIACDRQHSAQEGLQQDVMELHEDLRSAACFWQKGDKVSMCRFFGAHRAAKSFDRTWHSRLLGVVFVGLQLGILDKGSMASLLAQKFKPAPESTEPHRTPMPRGQDEVKQLRAACANTLHLAAVVLADGHNQDVQRMITSIADPLEAWHSAQNRFLRSAGNAAQWTLEQVSGQYWAHLKGILDQLSDPGVLEYVSLRVGEIRSYEKLSVEHPLVAWNDELATKMAIFAITLVGFRIHRHLELTAGWPSRFALAYHSDEQVRSRAITEFRRDYQLFEASKNLKTAFWKKVWASSVPWVVPC